ncbi:MAG: FG-GAP-like repeat-containing protein, partial [Prevotellaceae bacterium]|nr:FG-GAP-like repeat-containing protein [Prevotellaceae bacterium]
MNAKITSFQKGTSNNCFFHVALRLENTHLLYVNSAFLALCALKNLIIKSPHKIGKGITILNIVIALCFSYSVCAQTGNTLQNPIVAGTFSASFAYSNTQNTNNFTDNYHQIKSTRTKDVYYRFTINQRTSISATHCGSTLYDTYMFLLDASGNLIASCDDFQGPGTSPCGNNDLLSVIRRVLSAGTYYIVSEGWNANGNITTNISGTPSPLIVGNTLHNPIVAGTFNANFNYSNTQNTSDYSNDFHQIKGTATRDVFYSFTISKKMNVVVNHCNSALADTYLFLLDASGNLIQSCDDYSGDGMCVQALHSFIRRDLNAGTYYLVSEGYSSDGSITTNITGYVDEFGYAELPDEYSTESVAVGSLSGAFDVSASGGGIYSIPIDVPPGIGGIQPALAIGYNSQAGNGIAGWGCNISGISAITCTPKTVYHDGTARGITNLPDDAFMLNGQRLILVSGSPGNGVAAYNPEADPFTTVTMQGTKAANNIWFEVKTKDGMIYHYGKNSSTRQEYRSLNPLRYNAWYLEYVEDLLGNYMSYSYFTSQNVLYLSSITYGKNKNETSSLQNTVSFTYESRPDPIKACITYFNMSITQRLSRITCKTGSSVFRDYQLGYTNADSFSRLTSVTVKNGAGEALKPTQLGWTYLPVLSQSTSTPTITGSQPNTSYGDHSWLAVDLNGDGLSDLASVYLHNSIHYVCIYLAKKDASGNLQYTVDSYYGLGSTFTYKDWKETKDGCAALDFNGDGINELLIPYASHVNIGFEFYGNIHINKINCTLKNSTEMPLYAAGDLNNDGKEDIIYVEKEHSSGNYPCKILRHPSEIVDFSLNLSSRPEHIFLTDFNGNGMKDLMLIHSAGYSIFWNQGGNMPFSNSSRTNGTSISSINLYFPQVDDLTIKRIIRIGDFNGDGLPDFLHNVTSSNQWYFVLNSGDGTFTTQLACTLDLYDQDFTNKDNDRLSCQVFDFNSDGKSDVVITKAMYDKKKDLFATWGQFRQTYTCWMQSTGTSLVQVKSTSIASENDAFARLFTVGDFNGDGQADLFNLGYDCYNGGVAYSSRTQFKIYRNPSLTANSGMLTSITDGFGKTTRISYDKLTNPAVYTQKWWITRFIVDFMAPLTLVKSVVYDNGVAGTMTQNYQYAEAKMSMEGKGFLGFLSTTATNSATGVTTSSTTDLHGTYLVPDKTTVTTTVGQTTSTVKTEYTIVNKGGIRYFMYPHTKTETDLDGNATTTTYKFDPTYGNITEEKIAANANMYRTAQYSNYVSAGGTMPHKPQTINETQKHENDGKTFTRKTSLTYNTKGRVTKKIENDGTVPLTTEYSYDNIGNPVSQKISGAGLSTITYYTVYDANKRFPVKTYSAPDYAVNTFTY